MKKIDLGDGTSVSALGLGCMGMSGAYGQADRAEGIATIHAALESGVTLLDTGDFYGMGHNEMLIGEALKGVPRDNYQLSVKFDLMRGPDGGILGLDNRPKAVGNFLSYSLTRLGVDYIDIYRPSRLDPDVPIEDTIGAMADWVKAGYIRKIGLSEVGADTLRRAAAVHPIADLQYEYSLMTRGLEDEVLAVARELGIKITAYGVLARGLLGGQVSAQSNDKQDGRRMSPRFSAENIEHNLKLAAGLKSIADSQGCSVAQLVVAWVAHQGDDIIPIVGARRRERIADAVSSLDIVLSAEVLAEIEKAVPKGATAGTRYPAAHAALLDGQLS